MFFLNIYDLNIQNYSVIPLITHTRLKITKKRHNITGKTAQNCRKSFKKNTQSTSEQYSTCIIKILSLHLY